MMDPFSVSWHAVAGGCCGKRGCIGPGCLQSVPSSQTYHRPDAEPVRRMRSHVFKQAKLPYRTIRTGHDQAEWVRGDVEMQLMGRREVRAACSFAIESIRSVRRKQVSRRTAGDELVQAALVCDRLDMAIQERGVGVVAVAKMGVAGELCQLRAPGDVVAFVESVDVR